MTRRGLLIAFEGGDASGKSTQAALLAEKLDALLTREPGGTPYGEKARELFQLNKSIRIDPRTEVLLVASARAQHVSELILPTLASGRDVVTDRFFGSSLAYQGYGRGLDRDELLNLNLWATDNLKADLNLLIDVPRAVVRGRNGGAVDEGDRFETEIESFHEKVAEGYRELAHNDPLTWRVVDGDGTIDEVFDRVFDTFSKWQTDTNRD